VGKKLTPTSLAVSMENIWLFLSVVMKYLLQQLLEECQRKPSSGLRISPSLHINEAQPVLSVEVMLGHRISIFLNSTEESFGYQKRPSGEIGLLFHLRLKM
jgi:hypothetical protein